MRRHALYCRSGLSSGPSSNMFAPKYIKSGSPVVKTGFFITESKTHIFIMSFAELYVLASKVRSKLTREASNPKTSLRSLVLQANMLDNLMDHIASETEKKKAAQASHTAPRVSFSLPEKPKMPVVAGPSVTEYEIDYDSASDSDDDYEDYAISTDASHAVYYSGSDSEDDSEDDYYYLSDEEEEDDDYHLTPSLSYRQLPAIDLSDMNLHRSLSVIEEENEEMPELARSSLVSDSDSEIEDIPPSTSVNMADEDHLVHEHPAPKSPATATPADNVSLVTHPHIVRHLRHNAVYLMEHVF